MTTTEIPGHSRALVISGYGEPMEIREFPISPPEPGAILVKVETTTLCGSDIHLWQGAHPGFTPPLIPGHEAVGTVVAFGDGPHTDSVGIELVVGDRVVWEHEPCGHCYACSVLDRKNLCTNRRSGMYISTDVPPYLNGTISEYCYVWPRSGRLRVPDAVESTWASAASCALRTVTHAMERIGVIDYRHTVVIQGAGPLGLFATAVAATLSPKALVVIGDPAPRLDVARAFGAHETISIAEYPEPADRIAAVLEATGGRGGDVVCDFSGGRGVFGEGLQLTALEGRYLVVGTISGPPQPADASLIVRRDLTIVGSKSAQIDAYYRSLEFLERHHDRFDWDLLVNGPRYSLDDANLAFEKMKAFEEVKSVIEPHRLLTSVADVPAAR